MPTAAKPKKRSRLALPRQKGAGTATAVQQARPTAPTEQHGSQQQVHPSVAADDGTSISANSSPDYACLCSTAAASSAGVSSDSDILQPLPVAASATAVRTAGDHRSPNAATTMNDEVHHKQQQPVTAACKGQERVEEEEEQEEETEEKQQEERGVGRHARVSDSKRSRDPLRAVRLNGRPEVTAVAGAGGKGKQATVVTPSAAAAAVAAAASEVSQLLDGLEPKKNNVDCRRPDAPEPASPPTARERAGSSSRSSQQRDGSAGSKARSDLQHHRQQSAGRKRPRPATTTVPSASRVEESIPRAASRRAPAPPSPKRGREPAAATTEAAVDVVMLNSGHEAEEKSPLVPTKSTGGERGAAEPGYPGLPSPKREESSSGRRERCPVCSCAVWGLSVRARQASLESCS